MILLFRIRHNHYGHALLSHQGQAGQGSCLDKTASYIPCWAFRSSLAFCALTQGLGSSLLSCQEVLDAKGDIAPIPMRLRY